MIVRNAVGDTRTYDMRMFFCVNMTYAMTIRFGKTHVMFVLATYMT